MSKLDLVRELATMAAGFDSGKRPLAVKIALEQNVVMIHCRDEATAQAMDARMGYYQGPKDWMLAVCWTGQPGKPVLAVDWMWI